MKKVLVPTDFSENSKAGLQFAIQWSTVEKLELVFLHMLHTPRQLELTDADFSIYSEKERKPYLEKLRNFVSDIYQKMNILQGECSWIVIGGFSPDLAIMQYCKGHDDIDFICISTQGAGKLKRLLGTNTGNLITKSTVPVIAIPATYKVKPFESLMYAADFRHYKKELTQVLAFARRLKIPVEILHFAWPDEAIPDKEIIESGIKQEFRYPVKLHIEQCDATHSLVENLQKQIEVSKPSLAVMFTNQDRTLFQRIFLSSKAEQLSFDLKVPLLVFNKN